MVVNLNTLIFTKVLHRVVLLSPTLFLIFIDGLMKEIERTVPSLPSLELNGLLFADDFAGLSLNLG